MNWDDARLISDLEAEEEYKQTTAEEIKLELANQTVKINSLLLLAHDTGLRPEVRNMPVMHKDETMAQVFIFMGPET